jgi:hypothetical protein
VNDLTITAYTWNLNFIDFISVNVHYINDEFDLVSQTLEVRNLEGSQTSHNIANALFTILEEWRVLKKGKIKFFYT